MDRSEKIGFGVAVIGHGVLFGLLSVGFLATPNPAKLPQQPVEISLVPDVALEATAPQSVTPPAPSIAPDIGAPEDAAPPEPEEAEPDPEPEPTPPAPEPRPVPPKPAPQKPAPPKPAPPKPTPPKPAPAPRPAPAAKPRPPASEKTAPAKPARATASSAPARTAAASAKPAKPAAAKGAGSSATATNARPRGSRLGSDFLKGLSDQPSPSKSDAPRAAKLSAQAAASIGSAILRQVQPCADRQVTPGPGAERIRVTINLRLNRDGTLAARPTISDHAGVDDENRRYVARVDDLAIATFTGCSPLRGLPDALYDVPNGWSNFSLRYKLPG